VTQTAPPLPALRFATAARRIGAAARAAGLSVPAFRSPPRVPGASRTLRRYREGVVVSVAIRGRTFADVAADMVEGVLCANRMEPAAASAVRAALLEAATVDASPGVPGLPSPEARMAERQTQAA
jgi:hypothetical protein